MSAAASLTLLELPDRLIKFVLSSTSSPPTLAAAAATCRRLNSMVTEPFSDVWQLLNSGANIDWAEGAVTAQDAVPAKDSQCNLALAIDREAVLFSDGEQSLHLSPPPGTASAALTLREAAACAQARCGEVALAVYRSEDARRGLVAVAPWPIGFKRVNTKVRLASMAGRNLRSLRVGGALSAVAAGPDGLVATARRGNGVVQLWHAESGALVAQLAAHAEGSTIRFLAFRGRALILTAATDGTAAMHVYPRREARRSAVAGTTSAPPTPRRSAPPTPTRDHEPSSVKMEVDADGGGGDRGGGSLGGTDGGAGGEESGLVACGRALEGCRCRATGHLHGATCAELHGGCLLSGGDDGRMLVHSGWSSGRLLQILAGRHTAPIVSLIGAGAYALSATREGLACLWELRTGTCCRSLDLLNPSLGRMVPAPTAAAAASAAAKTADAAPIHRASASLCLAAACAHASGVLCLLSNGKATLLEWPAAQTPRSVRESLAPSPAYILPVVSGVQAHAAGSATDASAAADDDDNDGHAPTKAKRGPMALGAQTDGLSRVQRASETLAAAAAAAAASATHAAAAATGPPEVSTSSRFVAQRMAERSWSEASPLAGTPALALSPDAPEFMAAVLEVIASQVLQQAGDAAAEGSGGRIEPHHIRVAVRRDQDLVRLVGPAALEQGGLLRPEQPEDSSNPGDAGPSNREDAAVGERSARMDEEGRLDGGGGYDDEDGGDGEEEEEEEANAAVAMVAPAALAAAVEAAAAAAAGTSERGAEMEADNAPRKDGAMEEEAEEDEEDEEEGEEGGGVDDREDGGATSDASDGRAIPKRVVRARMARKVPSLAADAPAFMAAVLEVVASQVLQQAGDAAAEGSGGRIEPHHIRVAVRRDQDLVRLVGPAALEQGGLLRPEEGQRGPTN